MVLKDIISDPEGQEITTSLIMAQTADYFGITIDDLCSANRSRTMVSARHIAMYLCRELTDLSLPKIGREFGGRDHTTVMSADKKIRTLMAERRSTFNHVTELTSRIKQAAQSPALPDDTPSPTASNAAVDGAEDGTWRSERVAVEVRQYHCGMTCMSFSLSTDTPVCSPGPPTCHSPASLASWPRKILLSPASTRATTPTNPNDMNREARSANEVGPDPGDLSFREAHGMTMSDRW